MTIILYVREACEKAKLTIDVLRLVAETEREQFDLIVLDNGSEDGFGTWATEQTDFTYVYMDESCITCGKAINEVVEALNICGEFMLIEAGTMPVPGSISRLAETMRNNKVFVAASMNNRTAGISGDRRFSEFGDFSEFYIKDNKNTECQVLTPSFDGCVLDAEHFRENGGFDENLECLQNIITDYSLREIIAGNKVLLNRSAAMWKQFDGSETSTVKELQTMEDKWKTHYFNVMGNPNIVEVVTKNIKRNENILEIGCDMGATLLEIKNRCPDVNIFGVDINETSVKIANSFSTAKVADVETETETCLFDGTKFDYIIFGDVLEHLRKPEKALENCKSMLNSNGKIVISVPNLMHISIMKQLLVEGKFTYTEMGLLDKTHIHLFTQNELKYMLENIGYQIELLGRITMPVAEDDEKLIDSLVLLGKNTERSMYETYQYLVVASVK